MNMLRQTERTGHTEPVLTTPIKVDTGRGKRPELILPALDVTQTRELRERQKAEIEALFLETTDLRGLIANIKSEHAEKFAAVIGSTDFAQARLAGLYQALESLAERIDAKEITTLDQVTEEVYFDISIHEVFEDLVIRCAQNSL